MDEECVETLGRPISSLKVAELRDELAKRALVKTGNKKELVDRLRLAIVRQAQETCQAPDEEEEDEGEAEDSQQEEHEPAPSIEAQGLEKEESGISDVQPDSEVEGHEQPDEKDAEEQADSRQIVHDDQQDHEEQENHSRRDVHEQDEVHDQEETHEPEVQLEREKSDLGDTGDREETSKTADPEGLSESEQHGIHAKTEAPESVDANSDSEKPTTPPQDPIPPISAPFTLKRGISDLKDNSDLSKNEKRRKWSVKTDTSQNDETSQTAVVARGLSSQKLKELIAIKEPVKASEISGKDSKGTASKLDAKKASREDLENTIEESEKSKEKDAELESDEDSQIDKKGALHEVRNAGDEAVSDREPTKGLCISHLVRPFTVPQLKVELTKFGPLIEDKFWTNKVKSKCCVMYETIDVAQQTKEALHGTHWPSSNPKTLRVDYITEEEYDHHIMFDEVKEEKEANGNSDSTKKTKSSRLDPEGGDQTAIKKSSKNSASDINTKSSQVNRNSENAQPQELDDLFMKTKSKPPLFWLPLTDDQAEVKQKERRDRELREKERRKTEKSAPRRTSPHRRRSPDRRSPPRRRKHRSPRRGQARHDSPVRRRSPMRRHSPARKSPRRISPELSRRSPRMTRRSPMLNRRSPVLARRSPRPMGRSPEPTRRSPGPIRRSPAHLRRSPGPIRHSPGPIRRSPVLMRRSPMHMRRSPGLLRHSPGPIRRPPGPIRGSPGPVRRSPGPIRRSPGPIRRSPGPIRRSPGPIRRSPGPIRRSPGPVRRSPGPVRRSPGPIRRSPPGPMRRSPMIMRRSPLPIRAGSPMLRRSRSRSRSPIRRRSPVRRRSPPRNLSPGRVVNYPDEPRRADRSRYTAYK